jgi:hypothetical protein
MRSKGARIASLFILAAVACLSACKQSQPEPAVAHGSLPPPPAGQLQYAGPPLKQPFTKQAGNYFARTVFETDGPGNSHIEVRDVLIPPQAKGKLEALPGSAVIEAATGTVTLSTGDHAEALATGAMRSLPAGQELQFENSDSRPANIRLIVIRAR